jgi:hypothetical protein
MRANTELKTIFRGKGSLDMQNVQGGLDSATETHGE